MDEEKENIAAEIMSVMRFMVDKMKTRAERIGEQALSMDDTSEISALYAVVGDLQKVRRIADNALSKVEKLIAGNFIHKDDNVVWTQQTCVKDGFKIVAKRSKTVKWDQNALASLHETHRNLIDVKYSVKESVFASLPSTVSDDFAQAREVSYSEPKYSFADDSETKQG